MHTPNELDTMDTTQIDDYKCRLENELKEAVVAREEVVRTKLDLKRQMLLLELDIKKLDTALSKSREQIEGLRLAISTAKSKYWTVKQG
jgi:hypothetical protein